MRDTLFEKIGGMNTVNSTVTLFYQKVTSDPSVKHFFKEVDMDKQSGKLKRFLAFSFGAPLVYEGKDMYNAHRDMNINERHFIIVVNHILDTLKELNINQEYIDDVKEILLSTKSDIVKHK